LHSLSWFLCYLTQGGIMVNWLWVDGEYPIIYLQQKSIMWFSLKVLNL